MRWIKDNIDRLTIMMGKLATRDNGTYKQFKHHIYQSNGRGQSRNIYDKCNYDRENYQNSYRSNGGDRRIQYGQNIGRPRQDIITEMIIGEEILEVTLKCIKILEERIVEEEIEEIIKMKIITEKEVEVGLEKDIWTII